MIMITSTYKRIHLSCVLTVAIEDIHIFPAFYFHLSSFLLIHAGASVSIIVSETKRCTFSSSCGLARRSGPKDGT